MPIEDVDFALIGPGRLGLRLAQALIKAGWRCTKIRGRRDRKHYGHQLLPAGTPWDSWDEPIPSQTPPLIIVSVEDDSITSVAEALVKELPPGPRVILHTSGLLTSDALDPCREAGARVASWHPLQSFPIQGHVEFSGIPCAIEGDQDAVTAGFHVADVLGLEPWIIDRNHKALYHAAAVVGANLSHILIRAACELLSTCPALPLQPGAMLAPLIRTSLDRALESEGFEHLTGPIARDDEMTIQKHFEVLPEELRRAYRALAEYAQKEGRSSASDIEDPAP